ncbi:acetamidase/formamidase family protein [Demequina lignilytica]|uniref:Acetamidase/formamidase family protein n=1 Tax=Demequina lignilytica TaxID=3051663 RepID=A0AB35MJY0_9MICO|nr:acetamidase/formamidase family protein [Demequina sp. SYSU T0a273]MDN4484099.1 acetamidase/formamidase family protein [Demequina sp. SYSU T0a273]
MADFDGILQPGDRVPDGARYLPADPALVHWGRLPRRGDAAVMVVDPGEELVVDTVSHEGILADQGSDPVGFFGGHGVDRGGVLDDAVAIAATRTREATDGPHVVTGPIEVRGARPGDLLAITLLEATPRVDYGVISNRHGRGALPGEFPQGPGEVSVFTPIARDDADGEDGGGWTGRLPLSPDGERVVRFPLAPFLGIMGLATDTSERAHSVPPGAHGGNIDIRHLTAGATLYIPVQVPGALAYVGDPHFAQGHGEVSLTALEASLRARIRLDLIDATAAARDFGDLASPLAADATHLMPTGLDEDLDEAMRACVRQAIALLGARYGMAPHLAYAYLSAATDFEISQVVDLVKGVHARIRRSDFEGVARA